MQRRRRFGVLFRAN